MEGTRGSCPAAGAKMMIKVVVWEAKLHQKLTFVGQSQKQKHTFSWAGFAPQTASPQVGRCRGLQGCAMAKGCSDLNNGLECRLQNSRVISNQASRFRNFVLGPVLDPVLGLVLGSLLWALFWTLFWARNSDLIESLTSSAHWRVRTGPCWSIFGKLSAPK